MSTEAGLYRGIQSVASLINGDFDTACFSQTCEGAWPKDITVNIVERGAVIMNTEAG